MPGEILGYKETALEFVTTGVPGLAGLDGPPGGVTSWEGPWATATNYDENDGVEHGGVDYFATSAHLSGASTEPGVGASWETVWRVTDGSRAETARVAAEAAQAAAAQSASDAEDAKDDAETASGSATTSAGNAATSETNAATSAGNAATSETNADAAQTAAETAAGNAAASEAAAEAARDDAEIFAGIDPYYSTNGPKANLPTTAPGGGAIPDQTLGRYIDGSGDYQAARWNAGGGTWDDVGDPVPSSTHSHANKAVLDQIASAGSGNVITNTERNNIREVASQGEAEAATNNAKAMTPLRVKQQADARGVMLQSAYDPDTDGRVEAADQLADGTNTVTAEQARDHIDDDDVHFIIDDVSTTHTDRVWSALRSYNGLLSRANTGDARFPTLDQKAALAGTNGAPADGNRYVTDSDPRLAAGGGATVLSAIKTANSNFATLTDDPHLQLALEAATTYLIEGTLMGRVQTNGLKLMLDAPDGATGKWHGLMTGQQVGHDADNSFDVGYNFASSGANQDVLITITGTVTTDGAGTLKIRFGSGDGNSPNNTLLWGSLLKVTSL